jgi:hypothetical protein
MLGFLAIQFKCSANELVLYNQGELIRDTRNGLAVDIAHGEENSTITNSSCKAA